MTRCSISHDAVPPTLVILFNGIQIDPRPGVHQYERASSSVTSKEIDRNDANSNEQSAEPRNKLTGKDRELSAIDSEGEERRDAELLAARASISASELENRRLVLTLKERDAEIDALYGTKLFRYTSTLRRAYGALRRRRAASDVPLTLPVQEVPSYDEWVRRFDTLQDSDRTSIRARLDRLPDQPLVSILLPTFNPPATYLTAAIESVIDQMYENWELCIADDASTDPHVADILARYIDRDPRIKVTTRSENGHISAASNTALAMARGMWITPLDHDDLLAEHALALAMLAWSEHQDAAVIYSDEDKIDDHGRRQLPYFKPDFDPLLLLGQNYLTHLLFLRHDLVTAAGGYRLGFEGSQDWDLILRMTEGLHPSRVVHVPHVLYHWRIHDKSTASLVSTKPYALDAGQRAVTEHLARRGLAADVTRIPWLGHNRVRWHLPDHPPLVSIIIPTRDGALLQRCIDSILAFTSYPRFEILVIDNGSRMASTLDYLRQNDHHLTVIRDDRPFNYSALNNEAVRHASGTALCLLNDDTEVIAEDWLDEIVGHLCLPGVGAVGAKLYYSDGRIQHGGVIVGVGDVAGHAHRMSDRLSPGYCGRLLVAQNFSAVTGACMVVRREAWDEVGGLDEVNLAIAFNDVDFGLRLRQSGWRVVWTPHATLYHHESTTRGTDTAAARVVEYNKEVRYMQSRWAEALKNDPAYNPNLTNESEDFSLAWPPRVSYR
jgi:glycosyltransferase involved in cell wall biosynthesis